MFKNVKNIKIKDVAFFVGFTATVIWGIASYYSIKANKERLKMYKNDQDE